MLQKQIAILLLYILSLAFVLAACNEKKAAPEKYFSYEDAVNLVGWQQYSEMNHPQYGAKIDQIVQELKKQIEERLDYLESLIDKLIAGWEEYGEHYYPELSPEESKLRLKTYSIEFFRKQYEAIDTDETYDRIDAFGTVLLPISSGQTDFCMVWMWHLHRILLDEIEDAIRITEEQIQKVTGNGREGNKKAD